MQATERKRFVTDLIAISEVYGKSLSQTVIAIWWDALKRYDFDAVDVAFKRHTQSPDSGQFMPKPADIIRILEGTTLDTAMLAWTEVEQAVKSIGPWSSVTFGDPVTMRVLHDMGGWTELGQKKDEEWPYIGNEFRTRYKGYRVKGETPLCPTRLVGHHEAHNGRLGSSDFPHALIGNSERAAAIAEGPGMTALQVSNFTRLTESLASRTTGRRLLAGTTNGGMHGQGQGTSKEAGAARQEARPVTEQQTSAGR